MALTWTVPELGSSELWVSGLLISVTGLLMNAAGIGGGSVFVPLLMAIAGMSPHEAIPTSKFVIFLSFLAMFLIKGRTQVDWKLVRALVPMSLAGTVCGVLINTSVSAKALLVLQSVFLAFMTAFTTRLAFRKYASRHTVEEAKPQEVSHPGEALPGWEPINWTLVFLLPVVVGCGVAGRSSSSTAVQIVCLFVPILSCMAVAFWFEFNDSTAPRILPVGGFVAGVVGGTFGVGGGLVVSPLLLQLGTDPVAAVAVSATSALFTSASSALQYLFLGRFSVVTGLFLSVFGIIGAVGAVFVGRLLSKSRHKYLLYFVVAAAITASAVIVIVRTVQSQ